MSTVDPHIAVGFFTHIFDSELRRRYETLKASLGPDTRVFIVAEKGAPVPTDLLEDSWFFDFDMLTGTAAQIVGTQVTPGNCHLVMLAFFDSHPEFEYYWLIEYDVVFTGDWKLLFDECAKDRSGLLVTHLRSREQEPLWYWWDTLNVSDEIADKGLYRAFLPIYRISRTALLELGSAVRLGCCGHFEALVPTVINAANIEVSDFGEGRFYTSFSSARGELPIGTMRHRPEHYLPLLNRNFIYHPIKPRGKGRSLASNIGDSLRLLKQQPGAFMSHSWRSLRTTIRSWKSTLPAG